MSPLVLSTSLSGGDIVKVVESGNIVTADTLDNVNKTGIDTELT